MQLLCEPASPIFWHIASQPAQLFGTLQACQPQCANFGKPASPNVPLLQASQPHFLAHCKPASPFFGTLQACQPQCANFGKPASQQKIWHRSTASCTVLAFVTLVR
jgi:hypothetical protein